MEKIRRVNKGLLLSVAVFVGISCWLDLLGCICCYHRPRRPTWSQNKISPNLLALAETTTKGRILTANGVVRWFDFDRNSIAMPRTV
jgi:hypothetical protein